MNRELSVLISTLLQRIPIERIIGVDDRKKVYYDELSDNLVKDIMLTYCPSIGDASIELILEEIRTQINTNAMESRAPDTQDKINIFSMLSYYVRDILTFHENKVVCKYSRIIEWNELTRVIGKDLPIAAFLAHEDCENGENRENLFWPPVIGHNNDQINRILSKGMAENHFHLRGSTPYFDISWINLMNHPTKQEYLERLNDIEDNLRDKNKKVQYGVIKHRFQDMIREAALIRLYLSKLLIGLSQNELLKENFLAIKGIEQDEDCLNENNIIQRTVRNLLAYPELLQLKALELQTEIDITWWNKNFPDYLLDQVRKPMDEQFQEYWLLSGERWFLYHMLKSIFTQSPSFSREDINMFFAYIRIKNELRGELVQNNNIYGFDNFQIYQNRKDDFSHIGNWVQSEGVLARLAVRDVLINPSVKQLEIRISPAKNAQSIMEDIRGYDYAILRKGDDNEKVEKIIKQFKNEMSFFENIYDEEQLLLQKRYHYVFHFTKQKDVNNGVVSNLECRHYEYRKQLINRTAEIILFRMLYPEYAKRVVGIDACSREIGCRPEVFGRAFRTLKYYVLPGSKTDNFQNYSVHQLKFTYHVGEDFLDIIDGLRAIDEAIRFLCLGSGDRLGHAMALGIDARKWYAKKGNKVILSMQDYIDNIVWMHHSLINFGIENMSSLKGWLEEKYSQYFNYVYQPFVRNWNNDTETQIGGDEYYANLAQNGFDINTYYLSWLLRGDKPELYKSGGFINNKVQDQWKKYSVNSMYIKRQDIRNIPQVTLLYSLYHYNVHVKQRGSEVKTFRLHPDYPVAVSMIQRKMQMQIDRIGIAVETNPSSNYKISSLETYSDHPIREFYNIGLVMDSQKLEECPQMNVSINTDDDGVFSTRLENEFALLASALEESRDSDGKPIYKRQNIYQWLDNIREMGLRQSFVDLGES